MNAPKPREKSGRGALGDVTRQALAVVPCTSIEVVDFVSDNAA
jgi:hypothetical protein